MQHSHLTGAANDSRSIPSVIELQGVTKSYETARGVPTAWRHGARHGARSMAG